MSGTNPPPSNADTRRSVWRKIARPSWYYPFRGIVYFCTHRFLWPLLKARLLPCFVLSLAILILLFIWTYIPQALILLPFHGQAAWFNAAILVLGEGATVTALLFEAFLVDVTLADVFDAVLVAKGHVALVSRGREIYSLAAADDEEHDEHDNGDGSGNGSTHTRNPRERLGPTTFSPVYSPFSFKQIAEFILLLPLNFVPWVGVPVFLLLTGARGGPLHHHRYFKLLGLRRDARRREIRGRRLPYTWFGTAALMLQLVPGLSMLFLLTTAAGSGLWVADLEEDRGELHASQAQSTGEETLATERERTFIAARAEGYGTVPSG